MSSDKGSRERGWVWPRILGMMSPETRLFALIGLLADAALGAMTLALPSEHRIYAFVAFILLLVLIVIAAGRVISGSKSHDQDYALRLRAAELRERLIARNFLPQLIVAIPRGGLAIAGALAQLLGEERTVPVITLTRRGGPGDFENRFNTIQFNRDDFDDVAEQPIKVLIIDDISRSGATLAAAKHYVEAATDRNFVVETAAVTFYKQTHAIPPSFVVEPGKGPIRDASGELEPRSDET